MKRLEGEVLEALVRSRRPGSASGLEGHTVDPHQFLGMEVNPRAAAIAELVVWLGYLQWHFRIRGGAPAEPILQRFSTPSRRWMRCCTRSGAGARRRTPVTGDDATASRQVYQEPARPEWPQADYIVGNPPFIGGKDIRRSAGRGLRRRTVGSASAHQRERRPRHVLVGSRGRTADAQGHDAEALRLRHDKLDHPGIQASGHRANA